MIIDMTTNKELPEGYTSWFDFYQEAQHLVSPGYDKFEYVTYERPRSIIDLMKLEPVRIHKSLYSMRYVEQQTLAELIAQKETHTFSKEELEWLHYGLNYSDVPESYAVSLKQKVKKLYLEQTK